MTIFSEIILHDFTRPMRDRKDSRRVVGPYRWRPAAAGTGRGFYMQHDTKVLACARHGSGFTLRIEEAGPAWRHTWGDAAFQPIIARLPHGRGFLAGWTLGAGMCASVDAYIWTDEEDARLAARSEAEGACFRDMEEQEAYAADLDDEAA